MNKELLPAVHGYIEFEDPQKEVYYIDDIFRLIKLNFGYSPLKSSEPKASSKEYRTQSQQIRRKLKNKELPQSASRKTCFSKQDVYKLLRYDLYEYYLKKSGLVNVKKENAIHSKQNLCKTLHNSNFSSDMSLDSIKFRAMMKYLEKNYFSFDDEKILSDLNIYNLCSGESIESLSIDESLSLNRLLGDGCEYYKLTPKAQSVFKS